MSRFEFESWDFGRLVVNRTFSPLLRRHDWQTFDAIWSKTADAMIAKKMRSDRITLKFKLHDDGIDHVFFIKRHVRSSWKEYIKPLIRLTWPILGARNEWNALIDFHEAGLPTMIPVAIGEFRSNSFLITKGLEDCTKLSEIQAGQAGGITQSTDLRACWSAEIARILKRMHDAGMHHQDFYLGHILSSNSEPDRLFVIDLGRVQKHVRLSRRWIVKDLAQLNFSAVATSIERLRFMRSYLGRSLTQADRSLIRAIELKTASIARHSRKNQL